MLDFLPLHYKVEAMLFSTLRDVGQYMNTCREAQQLLGVELIWRELCRAAGIHSISKMHRHYPGCFWRSRLKRWHSKQVFWHPVPMQESCPPPDDRSIPTPSIFLHRASTPSSTHIDVSNGGAFIFGGSDLENCYNDVWEVTALDTSDGRKEASLCGAESFHDNLPVKTHTPHMQIRCLPLAEDCPSLRPAPRSACSWTTLGDDEQVYLFGGSGNNGEFFDDLWCFHRQSYHFTHLSHRGPPGRWGHTAVALGSKVMYVFGGTRPGKAFHDLWRYDTALDQSKPPRKAWNEVRFPVGDADLRPKGRGGHTAVVIDGVMYVFGGNTVDESFDDLWRIDLNAVESTYSTSQMSIDRQDTISCDWERISPRGQSPEARIGHSCVPIARRMILYGGRNYIDRKFLSGVYIFDVDTEVWERVKVSGDYIPHDRTGHSAIPHSNGILFFGGLVKGALPRDERATSGTIFLDLLGVDSTEFAGIAA